MGNQKTKADSYELTAFSKTNLTHADYSQKKTAPPYHINTFLLSLMEQLGSFTPDKKMEAKYE